MKKRWMAGLLALCLLSGCSGKQPEITNPSEQVQTVPGTFTLTFITVGKGDAFLLTVPDGRHYLVDTGKAQDYPQIVRTLRLKGVTELEGIFLSHGHKDHIGSLVDLMTAFPTKRVYVSARDLVTFLEVDPRKTVPAMGAELVELTGGETLDLGGVTAQIWVPEQVDVENGNNNSVIMRLVHGENGFLMMGDAETEEIAALLASDFPVNARVLKLGHHGETDGTTPELLDAVGANIGLITGNQEENPDSVNPQVAAWLNARQMEAYYSEGEPLDLCSDGTELTLKRYPDGQLPQHLDLSFTQVDREAQRVTIRNNGSGKASLRGCTLISQRGDEVFHFPADTTLLPGQTLTVACRDGALPGDLVWNRDSVWKKHRDTALIYDENMNLLDIAPAEDGA